MTGSIYDTIDRLAGDDALALEQAATRHRLPSWLLPGLIGLEHARVGRFGPGGLTARITELLERAEAGKEPPAELRAGSVRGLGPAVQTELVSLELIWFRQFGEARIEFRRDRGRPIVLIEGRNGYGKTHLVEALRFALADDRRSGLEEILHEYVPPDMPEATSSVVVELTNSSDGAVRVRRAVTFRRGPSGDWRKPSAPALTVEAGTLEQPLQDREAEEWLAQRFPPEVLDYFVFDAESAVVQKLSGQKGERLPDIRRQVEAAVGVQPLREVGHRCVKIAGDWERRAGEGAGGPAADSLEADARKALSRADGLREQSASLAVEQTVKRAELAELTATLRGLDPGSGAGTMDELSERLQRAEVELDHHLDLVRACLPETLPLALMAGPIASLLTEVGNDERWRDHPERARGARDAAREIAVAVAEGRFGWAGRMAPDRVQADLLALLGLDRDDQREELHELLRRAEAARGLLPAEESLDAVVRLPSAIEELRAQLAAGDRRRDDAGWRRDFDDLVSRRDALLRRVEEIARSIEDLSRQETELRDEAGEAARQARDAKKEERRRSQLLARADLARRADRALGEVADGYLARRIEAMERAASEMLRDIAHKRDLYDRVEVDRGTLRYRIVDRDGIAVPPDRSTGERMVLALALVHGLRRASGLRFPLFVEAPLKGLDALHQDRVIRQFLLQYRGQTILLVKPGEVPDSAAHLLREQVGERFCLSRPVDGQDVTRIDRGDPSLVGGAA